MRLVAKVKVREPSQTGPGTSLRLPIGSRIFNHEAFESEFGDGVSLEEHAVPVDTDLLPVAPNEMVEDTTFRRAEKRVKHYFGSNWPDLVIKIESLRLDEGAPFRDALSQRDQAPRKVFSDGWPNH